METPTEPKPEGAEAPPSKVRKGNQGNASNLHKYWKDRQKKLREGIVEELIKWARNTNGLDTGGIDTLWWSMGRPGGFRRFRQHVLDLAKKKMLRVERYVYDPGGEYKLYKKNKRNFNFIEFVNFSYDEKLPNGFFEFTTRFPFDDYSRDSNGRFA